MKPTIKIQSKFSRGNNLLYPDCEASRKLLALTRKNAFDMQDLLIIQSLGFNIDISGNFDPQLVGALA
jgi:hypothetical protein